MDAAAGATPTTGSADITAVVESRLQLEENASPALTLEAMMLELPQLRANAVAARMNG